MLHACVLTNQSVAGDLRQAPVHMYVSDHLPTTSPAKQPHKNKGNLRYIPMNIHRQVFATFAMI